MTVIREERRNTVGVCAWAVLSKPHGFAPSVYRYLLGRRWDFSAAPRGRVVWVMLNPSTADATLDDPTIRKCIGFSQRWGFGSLEVVNLFGYRATDPKKLRERQRFGEDVVGPENDAHIDAAVLTADEVIAAWGAHAYQSKALRARAHVIGKRLAQTAMAPVRRLGQQIAAPTAHPLMLAYSTPRVPVVLG